MLYLISPLISILREKGMPGIPTWRQWSLRRNRWQEELPYCRCPLFLSMSCTDRERTGSLRLKWELLRTERRTVFRLTWLKYMKGYGTIPCRGTGAEDTATAVYFIQAIFRPALMDDLVCKKNQPSPILPRCTSIKFIKATYEVTHIGESGLKTDFCNGIVGLLQQLGGFA